MSRSIYTTLLTTHLALFSGCTDHQARLDDSSGGDRDGASCESARQGACKVRDGGVGHSGAVGDDASQVTDESVVSSEVSGNQATHTGALSTPSSIDYTSSDAGSSTDRGGASTSGRSGDVSDAGACAFPVSASLSPHVPTVVLVTCNDAQGWNEVRLEYWSLDGEMHEYPLAATSAGPTVVVGLRPDTVYEYRVIAERDGETCMSRTKELRTGSAPALLPRPTVAVTRAGDVNPGYLLTTPQSREAGASGYVAVYDHQGVPVWWYQTSLPGLISRAHFSWDGRYVVARDTNPLGRDGGRIVRVPLDGSREESIEINRSHHDFTPVADGFLFLVGGGEDDCGTIQHWSDAGGLTEVYSLRDAFGETFRAGAVNPCHCNAIDYNSDDDSISVSCLNQNAFVKISSSGELIWVLGGNNGQSHFAGDVNWDRQHGHHLLTPSRILFFNNMGGGDSEETDSLAIELELDLEQRTARRVWEYASGAVSGILGDAQYAANGNILVTYSDTGEFHEVNGAGQLVQRWVFPSAIGYSHQQPNFRFGEPQ